MKQSKSKIAKAMLDELEVIDQKKEKKKITQKQHDVLSKKVVIKGLNKITK